MGTTQKLKVSSASGRAKHQETLGRDQPGLADL